MTDAVIGTSSQGRHQSKEGFESPNRWPTCESDTSTQLVAKLTMAPSTKAPNDSPTLIGRILAVPGAPTSVGGVAGQRRRTGDSDVGTCVVPFANLQCADQASRLSKS